MFPVFREMGVNLGLLQKQAIDEVYDWEAAEFSSVIRAPIPYSATTVDKYNMNFVSPFGQQKIKSWRLRHWLGTDHLGRDVMAGMIHGTRTAMMVGLISMLIASLIGIFFGAIAGYFGDFGWKLKKTTFYGYLLALPIGFFYAFISRKHQLAMAIESGNMAFQVLFSLLIFAMPFLIVKGIERLSANNKTLQKEITLPVDSMVMRLVEVIRSVPGLLLVLALVSLFETQSLLNVIIIIGLIRWTGITTFLRAELLRIRELGYIQSAKALGYSNLRIILKHALPNALTSVLIVISFGVAASVLMEAFLSFIGIGVPTEQVTWGSMLNMARQNYLAWWLAIFPGLAIFVTVSILNFIGDGLSEAIGR